mgnify:CR=1 FL=1
MPDNNVLNSPEESKTLDSAYLLNADAQAILEEAPSLDVGLEELAKAYSASEWDNKEEAKKVIDTYAQELRYRFKDSPEYETSKLKQVAPISFDEAEGETPAERIDDYEKKNKEFLALTDDPDYLVAKSKIIKSVESKATELRRLARYDEKGKFRGAVEDLFFRGVQEATGGIASALGAEEYNKALLERTDPSYDDDWTSYVASGIGMFAGATASSIGGPAGVYSYMVGTSAGAVRERYNQAKELTGDDTAALNAAAVETGAQVVMSGVGGRVMTKPAKALYAKLFKKEIAETAEKKAAESVGKQLVRSGLEMGAGQATAGVISNKAESIATDNPDKDLTDRFGRNFLLGAAFGSYAKIMHIAVDPKVGVDPIVKNGGVPPVKETIIVGAEKNRGPVPDAYEEVIKGNEGKTATDVDSEVKVVGSTEPAVESVIPEIPLNVSKENTKSPVSFITEDGSRYSTTPEGATSRVKVATNEEFHPMDRTFFVDKEIATKLAILRGNTDESGTPIHILTDGKKLYVKSFYVTDALEPVSTFQNMRLVEVPTEAGPAVGLHPVEVSRPRNTKGNQRIYRSHIGRPISEVALAPEPKTTSAGAASVYETKERKLAAHIRLSPEVDETIRSSFGDADLGLNRYFEATNVETGNKAAQHIADIGVEASLKEFLANTDQINELVTPELNEQGHRLFKLFSDKAEEAKTQGDTKAYEKFADMASLVANKAAEAGTPVGQYAQAFRMWRDANPELRVTALKEGLKTEALHEVAAEEKVSPESLRQLDKTIEGIDNEVTAIQQEAQKKADIVSKTFDPEIQETAKLQVEIEKEAKRRLDEYAKQEQAKIDEAERNADKLEEEATSSQDKELAEVKAQNEKAQARIAELEAEAQKRADAEIEAQKKAEELRKKLEERGVANAEKKIDAEISTAEKAVEKLSKEGKDTAKVAEGLNKLKETRKNVDAIEGLSAEEKKALIKLRRQATAAAKPTPESVLSAAEIKELEGLKVLTTKVKEKLATKSELPPKVKAKVDKLRQFAKEKKTKLDTISPEDFLSTKEKSSVEGLKAKREELKQAKAKEQSARKSYLSDEQKQRLKDLSSSRERVTKLKDKVTARQKAKLEKLSPEDQDSVRMLVKAVSSIKEGTTAHGEALKALAAIEEKVTGSNKSPVNNWRAYWFSNVLSGAPTHIQNISGNVQASLVVPAAYAITGRPDVAKIFIKELIHSIPESLEQAKNTFLTGQTPVRGGKFETKNDFVTTGPKYIRNLGYALRALSAADAFFYHSNKEAQAKAVAYHAAKKLGLRKEALRTKVESDLNKSPESWAESEAEARGYAALLEKQSSGKVKLTENQIRNTAWELMEAKRPDLIKTESGRFALENTFNNTPKGFLGDIYHGIEYIVKAGLEMPIGGKVIEPLSYVLPFMKVGFNLANNFLELSGTGFYKAIFKSEKLFVDGASKKEVVTKHELQRRTELGRALLGTISAGVIYGITRSFLNDKDPYIALYGPGPKDPDMKAQMRQQKNWMPYSLKIGNVLIPYQSTPLVFILGAMGATHDNIRWNKRYAQADETEAIGLAVMGAFSSFSQNSFLKSMSTVVSMLEGDTSKDWRDLPVNIAKGFVPASNALRMISNIVDNPISTKKDLWAKFISGIPIAQSIGTLPALNTFGEPIERSWVEKLSLNRFFTIQSSDEDWRWLARNNYDIPDAGGTDMKLSTTENKTATKKRINNMGAIFADRLTPEERYLLTEKSGPDIRRIVQKYRSRYGDSGHQERVQKDLKEDISKVRSNWKKKLFLR